MQSKASSYRLVPYVGADGVWTLPDETVVAFAEQAQKDGTFSRVFHTRRVRDSEDFLVAMQRPANFPVFAFDGDKPAAFGWLNNLSGNHAFAHFCILSSAWGASAFEIGRLAIDYWMAFTRSNGEPLLDVLIGTIPVSNTRAIAYAQRLGFVRVGSVPMMARNVHGDREAVMILYYCRN